VLPAFILLVLLAPMAHAGIPAPPNSIVPCLAACPSADIANVIEVRDFANNPVAGAFVVVDFSGCPGFHHCPVDSSESYAWNAASRMATRFTDPSGRAMFNFHGGGVCPGSALRVFADGILLATRALVNPDQDGDGIVSGPDKTILLAKVGSTDPTADVNCDGLVTAAEVSGLYAQHVGHSCALPTATGPRSWGQLKILYR
jgi:hypothetical protein